MYVNKLKEIKYFLYKQVFLISFLIGGYCELKSLINSFFECDIIQFCETNFYLAYIPHKETNKKLVSSLMPLHHNWLNVKRNASVSNIKFNDALLSTKPKTESWPRFSSASAAANTFFSTRMLSSRWWVYLLPVAISVSFSFWRLTQQTILRPRHGRIKVSAVWLCLNCYCINAHGCECLINRQSGRRCCGVAGSIGVFSEEMGLLLRWESTVWK